MKIETINENYNITLTISNEVGDKLHEAKTNTNTIQDINAMTGDNALVELYNNGLREIKKNNDELTTNVYRAFQNENIFIKVDIKDSTGKIWFEGNLYTEEKQNETKIPNLDEKIKEAIRNIPDHF